MRNKLFLSDKKRSMVLDGVVMETLREILKSDLAEKQARNANFSLRAYARYLEMNVTSLSLYLNQKRELSPQSKQTILQKLGFTGNQVKTDTFVEIDLNTLSLVSDWHFFAILSLMETQDYRHQADWIARRLNISKSEAKKAMLILERGNFIEKRGQRYLPTAKQFKTPSQIQSFAIRKSHFQALDLAKESLDHDPMEARDFSAMTMATSPKKLPEAAKRIRRFRRSLMKFLEDGEKTEVFRLSIQLFPLSRRTK